MKRLLVVMFLVFALVSWGCDGGTKTLSDHEEGIILIKERSLTEEEIKEECPNGGVKIVTGFDKNGNGELDEDEILDTHFVCHGKDGKDGEDGVDGEDNTGGADGEDGTDGEDGKSTLTQVIPIEEGDEGHNCENGGYWVITCEDDGDGECVDDTENIEAVCHGVNGDQGNQGADGACAGNNAPVIDKIEINGTEFVGTPVVSGSEVEIDITATDADGDELIYVVTGSGAIIEPDGTNKNIFTLTFNSGGVYYFSVIVSDGCQVAVKSFAVDVVFPHCHKGLCWSPRSTSTMTWDNANTYCTGLGGRLPKIQELRSLIKECPETEYPQPTGQDPWCEIEDPDKLAEGDWTAACNGCASDTSGKYSVFGDTGEFWSSSSHVDYPDNAWYVNFNGGYVNDDGKTDDSNVRCVR